MKFILNWQNIYLLNDSERGARVDENIYTFTITRL